MPITDARRHARPHAYPQIDIEPGLPRQDLDGSIHTRSWYVCGTRLFAAVAIAPFIVMNLTSAVWDALIHWATYLVRSQHRTFVLRPVPFNAALNFCASSNSSTINVPMSNPTAIGQLRYP
jgi:hypothetical protein